MIRTTKLALRARAASRGTNVESLTGCIVEEHADGTITVDERHANYPKPPAGLGDMVSGVVASLGITKERVSRLAGGDCGCQKRQEWLNEFGRKHLGIGGTPSGPAAG